MKKITVAMLVCLSGLFTAKSQEISKVVNVDPQLSDICNILNIMDINLFRFDLSSFLNDKYEMRVYIDEYKNNKKVKRNRAFALGNNIKSLDEIPEKHRDDFRVLKQIPEGKNEWNNIKELSVYMRKTNDSTSVFTIDIPEVMRMNQPVELHPVGEFKTYFYQARPFAYQETGKKEHVEIPLILYGSGWHDDTHNVIRFCGEKEIDTEMKADILTSIPHHYILGLELKKAKNTAR